MDSHKNFAASTLASPPSGTGGTECAVATGTGTRFPAVPFNATIWPVGTEPTVSNAEIVRVTNIASDTFTITRAQESSTARTHAAGAQIAATITAKTLTDIEGYLDGSTTFADGITVANGVTVTGGTVTDTVTLKSNAAAVGAGFVSLGKDVQVTVGAAGGATALPATPTGYLKIYIGSTQYVIPYYAQA